MISCFFFGDWTDLYGSSARNLLACHWLISWGMSCWFIPSVPETFDMWFAKEFQVLSLLTLVHVHPVSPTEMKCFLTAYISISIIKRCWCDSFFFLTTHTNVHTCQNARLASEPLLCCAVLNELNGRPADRVWFTTCVFWAAPQKEEHYFKSQQIQSDYLSFNNIPLTTFAVKSK